MNRDRWKNVGKMWGKYGFCYLLSTLLNISKTCFLIVFTLEVGDDFF